MCQLLARHTQPSSFDELLRYGVVRGVPTLEEPGYA